MTLSVITCVGALQVLLVILLVAAQRDGVRIAAYDDVESASLRGIAVDLIAVEEGRPLVGWPRRVRRDLATIAASRRAAGPVSAADAAALAALDAAIRRIERKPADIAAHDQARNARQTLRASLDAGGDRREAAIVARARAVVAALLGGLFIQLVTNFVVWRRFVAPAERRTRSVLHELTSERARIGAFYEQNPDGIAVYDANGFFSHANEAWYRIVGRARERGPGTHLTALWSGETPADAIGAFELAGTGKTASCEARLRGPDGGLIDVEMTFFPYAIGDDTRGVVVVTKDVREKLRARQERDLQSKRIAALYDIVAAHGRTWEAQVQSVLEAAVRYLGFDSGIVNEIDEGEVNVLALVGDAPTLHVGLRVPLAETLTARIVEGDDIFQVNDILASDFADLQLHHRTGWRSFTGMRISAGGSLYGILGLVNFTPRVVELSELDRAFVRMVAALLGTIIQRGRDEKTLGDLAFLDPLTGLPNRTIVQRRIEELVAETPSDGMPPEPFAVYFIDLDKFKAVNDLDGHHAGDEVLRLAARRLQAAVRDTDLVARMGGDEFVIVQSSLAGGSADAATLANRLIDAIGQPFRIGRRTHRLGCSVGVSFYPADGRSAAELVSRADDAMYRSKQSGAVEFAAHLAPQAPGRIA